MTVLRNLTSYMTSTALSGVFFCSARATAVRALALLVSASDQPEQNEQGHTSTNAQNQGHEALSNPAKPMNASDRQPAMMNVSAVPLAISGTVTSSLSSLIDAISTKASVNPSPAPQA